MSNIRKIELNPKSDDDNSSLNDTLSSAIVQHEDETNLPEQTTADTNIDFVAIPEQTNYFSDIPVAETTTYESQSTKFHNQVQDTSIFDSNEAGIPGKNNSPESFFANRYDLSTHTQTKSKNVLRAGLSDGNLDLESQIKTGARIYRLKGFTTVARIKRKFKQENRQRKIRNLLTVMVIILFIIILLVIYNPIKDIPEWRKILGLDSAYGEQTIAETLSMDTD